MKDKDTKERLEAIEKKLDMIIEHFSIGITNRSPVEIMELAIRNEEKRQERRRHREQKKRQENKP